MIVASILSRFLPIWIITFSVIAYFFPNVFLPIQNLTGPSLSLIFLLMGMSLSTSSLKQVLKHPKIAFLGVFLKWTITVGMSILIANILFSNNPDLAAGIILAGSVPSGTSANLYTFIAGGEVALSITMATMETIIGPFLTPAIVQTFAGKFLPIEFWPLFINIIYIVLIPIFIGLFLQFKVRKFVDKVNPYTKLVSTLALLIIILSVVSKAQHALNENLAMLPLLFVAVSLLVVIPMMLGYFFARVFKVEEKCARSILFHVGITNSALSATLAMAHINSVAAVPSAITTIVNLTIGALMANIFANKGNSVVTSQK